MSGDGRWNNPYAMPALNLSRHPPLRRPQPVLLEVVASDARGPESEVSSVCTNISDSYSEITKNLLKQYKKEKKQANRKIENVMLSAEASKGHKRVEATAERARNEYETKLWEVKGLVIEILESQTERIKNEAKKHNVPFSVQLEQLKRLTSQMNRASEIIDDGPSKAQLTQLTRRLMRLNEAYEGGDYYQQETFEDLTIMTVAEPAMTQRETFGQRFSKFAGVVAESFGQLWMLISTADECASNASYSVGSQTALSPASSIASSMALSQSNVPSPLSPSPAHSPSRTQTQPALELLADYSNSQTSTPTTRGVPLRGRHDPDKRPRSRSRSRSRDRVTTGKYSKDSSSDSGSSSSDSSNESRKTKSSKSQRRVGGKKNKHVRITKRNKK